MNKDKFQVEYKEVFQKLKEEEMNWNFEDFLAKAEEKTIPVQKNNSTPKWYWLAASLVMLFGLVMFFNTDFNPTKLKNRAATRIESQIEVSSLSNIKPDEEFPLTKKIATEPALYKKSKYKKSAQNLAQHILKSTKKRHNTTPVDAEIEEYNPDFVVVNGKPIASENEAINYTKNALEMLGGNINTALENAQPVKLLTVNF